MLTSRATAHKATIGTPKSDNLQRDWIFQPKVFSELKSAQSIVLACDGVIRCQRRIRYLKPVLPRSEQILLHAIADGEIELRFDSAVPSTDREPYKRYIDFRDWPICVFTERNGQIEAVRGVSIAEKSLQVDVRNIALALGDEISEQKPLLDSAACTWLAGRGGHPAVIGRWDDTDDPQIPFASVTAEELVADGSLSAILLQRLRDAVEHRRNTLISVGTSSGKMTLSDGAFISGADRFVLIEDASYMPIQNVNLV